MTPNQSPDTHLHDSPSDGRSRRAFLTAAGSVAVGVGLAGCSGSAPSADGSSAERTFQMVGSSIRTLDPAAANDSESTTVVSQLFDGLVHYPKGDPDPELLLADDHRVSDDGTVHTFELDPEATFSDGRPVRAADVVYSFERIAASDNSTSASALLDVLGVEHDTRTVETEDGTAEEYDPGTLGVEALDDRTVEIRLSEPFHAALGVLAYPSFSIVPEGVVGDVPGYDGEMSQDEFATSNPIGAGPFTLKKWEKDVEYAVSARDDYRGDGPYVAGIHWRVTSDPAAAYTYATNENADAFWVPSGKFDPSLVSIETTDEQGRKVGTYGPLPENGKTVQYRQVPLAWTYYLGFNTEQVEKPVRQAIAYVLNQQTQIEEVHAGRGSRAAHITPPGIYLGGNSAYRDHAENYPYGLAESQFEAASDVLSKAGYGPDDPASVRLTVYEASAWKETATLLRDKLARVGVDMTVEQAPFASIAERGRNGELDVFSYGWTMDYPSPDSFLKILYPPSSDDYFFRWGGTPAADRAKRAWERVLDHPSASETDRQARTDAFREMETANWEDVVALPVYHPVGEGFYYDWVDVPKTGAAGFSKHKYNHVKVGRRD
ncbi:ABC transporter substrate-binding protein [Halorussus limi]|uniref:ABC transporter substrate-binding protein n=1 Tax=Halorussus limi TaxID=2938695 RepID=A0A8U0HSH5_9EURY|nr:ABC transporter substrate-binding protein [Halorussus limi]UPV74062.1 ABC transporter substrate-binding protein [Halorussus limi]